MSKITFIVLLTLTTPYLGASLSIQELKDNLLSLKVEKENKYNAKYQISMDIDGLEKQKATLEKNAESEIVKKYKEFGDNAEKIKEEVKEKLELYSEPYKERTPDYYEPILEETEWEQEERLKNKKRYETSLSDIQAICKACEQKQNEIDAQIQPRQKEYNILNRAYNEANYLEQTKQLEEAIAQQEKQLPSNNGNGENSQNNHSNTQPNDDRGSTQSDHTKTYLSIAGIVILAGLGIIYFIKSNPKAGRSRKRKNVPAGFSQNKKLSTRQIRTS